MASKSDSERTETEEDETETELSDNADSDEESINEQILSEIRKKLTFFVYIRLKTYPWIQAGYNVGDDTKWYNINGYTVRSLKAQRTANGWYLMDLSSAVLLNGESMPKNLTGWLKVIHLKDSNKKVSYNTLYRNFTIPAKYVLVKDGTGEFHPV